MIVEESLKTTFDFVSAKEGKIGSEQYQEPYHIILQQFSRLDLVYSTKLVGGNSHITLIQNNIAISVS